MKKRKYIKKFNENIHKDRFVARKSNHIESDIERNWSS